MTACGISLLALHPAFAEPPNSTESVPSQSARPATGTVPASAYPSPPPGPPERTHAGIPLGSFLLLPELGTRVGYNDNIFATPTNEKEDELVIFSPSVLLKSNWRTNQLRLGAGGDFGRYFRYTSENYNDYYFDGSGRYDFSRRVNLFGGAGYSHNHESRTSPDAVNGLVPTVYTDAHAFGGTALAWGKWRLRVGANGARLDFRNVPSLTGEIINDDRDRSVFQAGGRLLYKLNTRVQPFLQGNFDRRVYALAVDQYGDHRDSNGYRIAGGVSFDLRPSLTGEALAGYIHQHYTDPPFSDVDSPDFGLRLSWRMPNGSTLGFFLDRRLEETTVAGSAGYLETTIGLNLKRSLVAKWTARAHLAVMNDVYEEVARTDRVTDAGVGLSYELTPHLALEADYRLLNRNSDDPAADYFSNAIYLSLRGRLYPLPTPPYTPRIGLSNSGRAERRAIGGGYVGLQTVYGSLDTALAGARGSGTEAAEYGDTGFSSGLIAGYGFMHGKWYFGIEAHVADSNAVWSHSKPGGRVFSVGKNENYGAGFRVGYALRTGTLLFTDLGGTWTGFDTYYQTDAASPAVTASETAFGPRFGLGVDAPISRHLFVRMDYSYTDYDRYSISVLPAPETFGNSEGLFGIGVGWLFNGYQMPSSGYHGPVVNVSGFFAGAAAGYGAMYTPIHADQTQSSSPPSTLDADFSGRGILTNVFTGYGLNFGHFYVGLELDGDIDKANWGHVREGGGRSFSVDAKGDLAASLRLGWTLHNGTLFYVRIGKVRGKFHTTYIKGNNSSYWISRDDNETGTRYGVGVDVPLDRSLFVRLGYTYTHFEPYQFATQQAYPDTVRIDNNETVAMLGIGIRF